MIALLTRRHARARLQAGALCLREHEKGFDDFVAMADRRMNFPLAWWSGLERGGALLFERHPAG